MNCHREYPVLEYPVPGTRGTLPESRPACSGTRAQNDEARAEEESWAGFAAPTVRVEHPRGFPGASNRY
jgi:hypothetical protein